MEYFCQMITYKTSSIHNATCTFTWNSKIATYSHTGVAKILSGGGGVLFLKADDFVDDLFSRLPQKTALKPQPRQKCPKIWLLLCLGVHLVCWSAFTKFPCKLCLKKISLPWGCRCTHCTPWLRLCTVKKTGS